MTIARRKQLRLDITPYYHCLTRCVRRAFICGRDKVTGRDFSHRRDWIEKHLFVLTEVFCIDIAGYAILSNHYHLVLHVDQERANKLSDKDVIERWHKLYNGPDIVRSYLSGDDLTESELETVKATICQWREQLSNISRFMGHLNESIARRANKEDRCKGRFWESRFKLQAILDLKALLRTLCYVDLNPVRARMAKTPETSHYTSIRRRLQEKVSGLMPFAVSTDRKLSENDFGFKEIPIGLKDYLHLLDYTGREIRQGKKGFIQSDMPPIIERLGYSERSWSNSQRSSVSRMQRAIGSSESIKRYCETIGLNWIW